MKQNKIPKNEYIRKPVGKTNPYKDDVIYSNLGQWKYPGQVTRIPSGDITMQGVPYPVYGEDNLGYSQMMYPGMDYQFPGQYVTEYPMAMYGGDPSLSDITGHYPFGGQNTKTHTHMSKGGWLDSYAPGGESPELSCPAFHKYDYTQKKCVPFTEQEKANYALKYMKSWVSSPRAQEMLNESIKKDAPIGDINNYVKDVSALRLKATNPKISILEYSPESIGESQPFTLMDAYYKNKQPVFLTEKEAIKKGQYNLGEPTRESDGALVYKPKGDFFNRQNDQDAVNFLPGRNAYNNNILYLKEGLNNLTFKQNAGKDLKAPATFYTKNKSGEHAYVYPHEISHLQDMGAELIPNSDKSLMKSFQEPNFENRYDKFNKDKYSKSRQYTVDKELYEKNYDKFKKQQQEYLINAPEDNKKSYDKFIDDNYNKNFYNNVLDTHSYLSNPTETRARLNAVRMYGKAANIYDPFIEKLTPEKYKELLKYHEKQNPNDADANQLRQLRSIYTDDQILELLNKVSKVKNNNQNNIAKYGGWLDEYQKGGADEYEGPVQKDLNTMWLKSIQNEQDVPTGIDNNLLIRQQYKESTFNPNAVSKAKARGLAQIKEDVEKDAIKAGVLKKGENIFDPEVNKRVQEWYMNDLYDSSFINKPGQKDSVKLAKALAAYNWGRGNTLKHLNEQKKKGIDIYNSYNWVNDMPKETRDYVNKILLKKDPQFEKDYEKAYKKYSYKEEGGWLDNKEFRKGGPYTLPKLKRKARKYGTSKNIQSSINKIFTRNYDVFGPSGKNIYNPNVYKTGGWLDNLD